MYIIWWHFSVEVEPPQVDVQDYTTDSSSWQVAKWTTRMKSSEESIESGGRPVEVMRWSGSSLLSPGCLFRSPGTRSSWLRLRWRLSARLCGCRELKAEEESANRRLAERRGEAPGVCWWRRWWVSWLHQCLSFLLCKLERFELCFYHLTLQRKHPIDFVQCQPPCNRETHLILLGFLYS